MRFKLKEPLEGISFFGRQNEKTRLLRFLTNPLGGTLLIAGERGAGKTSLVDHVLDESASKIRRKYSPLKLTRSKFVRVELPFLPKHLRTNYEQRDEYKAELTSLILKALVQAMATENTKRIKNRVDIRTKWFRPIGYNRELDELDKLTRFSSITEKINKTIAVTKINVSGTHELAYSHDLSDTIIEVKLRRLLQTYSDQLRFVFVFDELDKLNGLAAIDFVYYLKNLFTHSGAHFIFITTDQIYVDIDKTISQKPYDIEHTLFTEKILLNNLPPKEFMKWLSNFFHEGDDRNSVEYYKMAYTIAWQTKQHPYDALNLLRRSQVNNDDGSEIDTELLNGLLDSLTWSYYSTMQTFIDYVYTKHADKNDSYFNKILYKSIRTSAQLLIDRQQKLINRQSFLTTLFVTEDFLDVSDELTSKHTVDIQGLPKYDATKVDDWRDDISKFPTNQIQKIESALMNLYFLLDREGSLSLSTTEEIPQDKNLLTTDFIGDAFNLYNLEVPYYDTENGFDTFYEPTQLMRELQSSSVKQNIEFYQLYKINYWFHVGTSIFDNLQHQEPEKEPVFSTNYRYIFQPDIKRYGDQLNNINSLIDSKIAELLNQYLNGKGLTRLQFVTTGNHEYTAVNRTTNKQYKVLFNNVYPAKGAGLEPNAYYFNLVDYQYAKTTKRVRKEQWKDHSTGQKWSNIELALKHVSDSIFLIENNK